MSDGKKGATALGRVQTWRAANVEHCRPMRMKVVSWRRSSRMSTSTSGRFRTRYRSSPRRSVGARRAAPDADEVISYNIPTYKMGGRAVLYFAAWKSHIAVYPVPETDDDLERELQPYRAVRSTLRFPLRQAMPYDLIERVFARHVAQQNR
jgi:uncharacterized protein YdhG (YjbR/CyaY superfamily)